MDKIVLSPLGHTWIFDIDGTLVKHNGYKIDGHDTLLPGVKDFFDKNVRVEDFVLLLTSRESKYLKSTKKFLKDNGIRFDSIVNGLPFGERILINEKKPSGLETCVAVNLCRDNFAMPMISIDEEK